MDKNWIAQDKFYTFCMSCYGCIRCCCTNTRKTKLIKIMGSIDKFSFMQPTCQWINNLSRVDIQRCLQGNSIASSYVSAQNVGIIGG